MAQTYKRICQLITNMTTQHQTLCGTDWLRILLCIDVYYLVLYPTRLPFYMQINEPSARKVASNPVCGHQHHMHTAAHNRLKLISVLIAHIALDLELQLI